MNIPEKLIVLSENDVLSCQTDCEDELMDILDELAALVTSAASLPFDKRLRLYNGIVHLRGHIRCETAALEGEIEGRKN